MGTTQDEMRDSISLRLIRCALWLICRKTPLRKAAIRGGMAVTCRLHAATRVRQG